MPRLRSGEAAILKVWRIASTPKSCKPTCSIILFWRTWQILIFDRTCSRRLTSSGSTPATNLVPVLYGDPIDGASMLLPAQISPPTKARDLPSPLPTTITLPRVRTEAL